MIKMKLFFCTLIAFLFTPAIIAQVNNGPAKSKTYAVVVGISKYENLDEDAQLEFADRDAKVFADYLKSKGGASVPEENIKLLLNEAATYSNIYDALKWLLDSCRKNDLAYFYFSGHGSLENVTLSQEGYLLAYNTLPNNFAYNAVRIGYVNDMATTLSARNNGKVIMITDACHSGSVAIDATGIKLAADQLRISRSNEIRLSSCQKDQVSNEDVYWGGGRSVFSYYLVKGLLGEADIQKDKAITLQEIRYYLDSVFARDKKLASLPEQKPVVDGKENFKLGTVSGLMLGASLHPTLPDTAKADESGTGLKPLAQSPLKYFFSLLEKEQLQSLANKKYPEEVIDFYKLSELPVKEIPFAMMENVTDSMGLPEYALNRKNEIKIAPVKVLNNRGVNIIQRPDFDMIEKLDAKLREGDEAIKKFNDQLVLLINNRTQEIINAYLKGDAAELEKRQYYNSRENSYAVYLKMFELALKLAEPGNEAYRILQLKQQYFTGVAARLRFPTVAKPLPLIDSAVDAQKKAMTLEFKNEPAAFIRNELGILYTLKKQYIIAKEYFLSATQIAPKWAIPWGNLVSLYGDLKEFDKGFGAATKADSLQPNLTGTLVNTGMLFENTGNYLLAEEKFRKAIKRNERYYLPFERMGFVSLKKADYAAADSFFYEADSRKKKYYFTYPKYLAGEVADFIDPRENNQSFLQCYLKNEEINNQNLMGKLLVARITEDEGIYKSLIQAEKTNPLAYHFLGNLLYRKGRYQEAEIILKMAIENYLDGNSFNRYADSMSKSIDKNRSKDCIIEQFKKLYYDKIIDHYNLAAVYESWGHYTEAEETYRYIIVAEPAHFTGYKKLAEILEKRGRYDDAVHLLSTSKNYNERLANNEITAFYKRMTKRFPNQAYWYYMAGIFYYNLQTQNETGNNQEVENNVDDKGIFNEYQSKQKYLMRSDYNFLDIQLADVMPDPEQLCLQYLLKADSLFQEEALIPDDINLKIGNLYLKNNDFKKAVEYLKKSDDQYPGNANTKSGIAAIYRNTYDYKLALDQLDSLYKYNQLNYPDQLMMATYCMLAGRLEDAGALLKNADTVYPFKTKVTTELKGRMQMLSNNPAKAIPFFKDQMAANPTDSMTMYTIARLYAASNDKSAAWSWLQKSIGKGFSYYWVLRLDPVWNDFRKSNRWKELTGKIEPKKK